MILKKVLSLLFILLLCNNHILLANKISESSLFINRSGSVWVEAAKIKATITASDKDVCIKSTSPFVIMKAEEGTTPYTFVYKINNGSEIERPTTGTNDTINIKVSTATAGTYKYTLVSVKSKNVTENQTGKEVTVNITEPPTVDFNFTDNQCSGTNVNFTPTVKGASPFKYEWTFEPDNTDDSEEASTIFRSYGCGTEKFNVKLVVTDKNGCTTTKTKIITIKQQPLIDFIDIDNPYDSKTYFNNCSNASSINSKYTVNVGNRTTSTDCINSYNISWGDGSYETNVTFPIQHSYDDIGTYNMIITAIAKNGCNVSKTYVVKNISNPSGGIISPGSTQNLCAPTEYINFSISNWGANSPGTIYNVNYDDGNIVTFKQDSLVTTKHYNKTNPSLSENFPVPYRYNTSNCPKSNYTVTLTVVNACGYTTGTTSNITVLSKPNPLFKISGKACVNSAVVFDNTTTMGYSGDCNQSGFFSWFFGDGNEIIKQFRNYPENQTHTYTKTGNYKVRLETENKCGISDYELDICIDTIPLSFFTLDKTNGCFPLTVNTNNTSKEITICNTEVKYKWEVAYLKGFCGTTSSYTITDASSTIPNGTSTSKNTTFVFNNSGTYIVKLTATNDCGSNTVTDTVTVIAPPRVSFTPFGTICETLGGTKVTPSAKISNNCGTSTASYSWSFPGGLPATSTEANPGVITYNTAGTYKISLDIVNDCEIVKKDTTFTIHPMPKITGNIQTCVGETEILTGDGTGANFAPWISRNTAIATVNNAAARNICTVRALQAGSTYIVYKNAMGCQDSVLFTVNELPTISGNLNTCLGNSSKLSGSASPAITKPWLSSDESVATVNNVGLVVGLKAGTTNITYINANGCKLTKEFTVNPLPVINGNLNACIGGSNVQLTGLNPSLTTPWTSSDTNIAEISNNGLVSPKALGTTTITFTNSNGCKETAEFTVNNPPTVNKPSDQTVCNGNNTTEIVFSGSVANASYKWELDKNGIGIPASGTGNIVSFKAVNNSSTPITATFTITPTLNGCDGKSEQFSITILPSPFITSQPQSASVCVNSSYTLNVAYSNNVGEPDIEWYYYTDNDLSATLIPNENKTSLLVLNNNTGTTYYYCTLNFKESACKLVITDTAIVTVNPHPQISLQPKATQLVCKDAIIEPLTVTYINGAGTANYQWFKNTVNSNIGGDAIPNATNSAYTPDAFSQIDDYFYYVVINLSGSGCNQITSEVAHVKVVPDPVVSVPLNMQTQCQNATAFPLKVNVSGGVGSLSYQWYSHTSAVNSGGEIVDIVKYPTAITNNFIPPTNVIGTKYYYCVVSQTGVGCDVTSSVSEVTVVPAPEITSKFDTSTVCLNGTTNVLKVTYKNGTGIPTYQWYKSIIDNTANGTPIVNANTDTYQPLSNEVGTWYYYCMIEFNMQGCNIAISPTVKVIIVAPPSISLQPLSTQTICVGGSIAKQLQIRHKDGLGLPSYQWYKNSSSDTKTGIKITNARDSVYMPSVFDVVGKYYYYCVVTMSGNGCGSDTSLVAEINVVEDPKVISQALKTQTVCQGAQADILKVTASGGVGPYAYQWYKNSKNETEINENNKITGEINDFIVPETTNDGTTYYYCHITQPNGSDCSVISETSAVVINLSPTITEQPKSDIYCKGNVLKPLSIEYINGVGIPSYKWFMNTSKSYIGSVEVSTTASYIPVSNVGTTYYYCIITFSTGGCNTLTSDFATVTVNQYPVIESKSTTIGSGTAFTIIPSNSITDIVPIGTTYTWAAPTIEPNANLVIGATAESSGASLISQVLTNVSNSASVAKVTYKVTPQYNGCYGAEFEVIVIVNAAIEPKIDISNISCFGKTDGSITVKNIEGGSGSYTYKWGPAPYETINQPQITGLSKGEYTIEISDNAGGLPWSSSIRIDEPDEISLSTDYVKNISCFNAANGTIGITVKGGTEPYKYAWSWINENGDVNSTFSNVKDISNLSTGKYIVTVTDKNDCNPKTLEFLITQPSLLTVNLDNKTNIKCNGDSIGSINVIVEGGTKKEISTGVFDYSYEWTKDGKTISRNKNLMNVTAGAYSLIVTDNEGCNQGISVQVTEPDSLDITSTVKPMSCYNKNDASIKLDIKGGVGPYNIAWHRDSFFEGSGDFKENLSAGTYTITVTDGNNCQKIETIIIQSPPVFEIKPIVKNVSCFGAKDGSIVLNFKTDYPNYSFKWKDSPTAGDSRYGLEGDSVYTVEIKTNDNCAITESFYISKPQELFVNAIITNPLDCNNPFSGSIELNVMGGTKPYNYKWSNGQVSKDVSNLQSGNYWVDVTDSLGCKISKQFKIYQPIPLSILIDTIPIFDCNTLIIKQKCTAKVTGGVPPYKYKWTPENVSVLNNEIAEFSSNQFITLEVTDNVGCTSIQQFNSNIEKYSIDYQLVNCNNNTYVFDFKFPDFLMTNRKFYWDFGDGTTSTNINPQHVYRQHGMYTVDLKVVSRECTASFTQTVKVNRRLNVATNIAHANDCNNPNSGAINLNVTGGLQPYKFEWFKNNLPLSISSNSKDLNNLEKGIYSVIITDSLKCDRVLTFEIKRPLPLKIDIDSMAIFDCSTATRKQRFIANVTGGIPPYKYIWNDVSDNATKEYSTSQLINLVVADSIGCTTFLQFNSNVGENTIDYKLINCNKQIYQFDFLFTDNLLRDRKYIWDFGDATTSNMPNPQHAYKQPGIYTVELKVVSNECTASYYQTIKIDPTPMLTFDKPTKFCKNDSLILKVEGADTYVWSNGSKDDYIVINTPGDYFVRGFTNEGCDTTVYFSATHYDNFNYSISTDKDFIDFENPDVKFWSSPEGILNTKHLWNFGDSTAYETGNNFYHTFLVKGEGFYDVKLQVTNPYGCNESATKRIWILPAKIPNTFSPNHDGVNDVFMAGWRTQVFNRNGLLLFEGTEGWDGIYNGIPVSNGTYFYVITFSSPDAPQTKTGFITVIR